MKEARSAHSFTLAKAMHAGRAPGYKALPAAALPPAQPYAWYNSAGSFLISGNETKAI